MVDPMKKFLSGIVLCGAVLICLYPFAWMFLSSFKTNREIYQPTLFIPSDFEPDSYLSLFSDQYIPFFVLFLELHDYFGLTGTTCCNGNRSSWFCICEV